MDRDRRRKDSAFFILLIFIFYYYLKTTEIEYCGESQELKNCRCNLKVSVAAEEEFIWTPGCGSLLNF